jgi:hypothetical protein
MSHILYWDILIYKRKVYGYLKKKKKKKKRLRDGGGIHLLFTFQFTDPKHKKNSADQDTTQPQQVVFMDLFKQIYIYI